jgi:hypothetical protein
MPHRNVHAITSTTPALTGGTKAHTRAKFPQGEPALHCDHVREYWCRNRLTSIVGRTLLA